MPPTTITHKSGITVHRGQCAEGETEMKNLTYWKNVTVEQIEAMGEDTDQYREIGWFSWATTPKSLHARTTRVLQEVLAILVTSPKLDADNTYVGIVSQRANKDKWVYETVLLSDGASKELVMQINIDSHDEDTRYSIRDADGQIIATLKKRADLAQYFGAPIPQTAGGRGAKSSEPLNPEVLKQKIAEALANVA